MARDRKSTSVTIRLRMEQVVASSERNLGMLDTADQQKREAAELRTARLTTRSKSCATRCVISRRSNRRVDATPDRQISLTDPDARTMASAGNEMNSTFRRPEAKP